MRCSTCGEKNTDRAKFCSNCGAALGVGLAPAVEERKVVSVLFVDLVGFTARSDHADPEDVRSTLRVYHDLLRREIERWGGTVEKFIGDAVMAVFGAPVAHEDDAERAVRAGLRILDAIDHLNEDRPGLDLSVRGAVNTGEAVVVLGAKPEAGEAFVTGDVVNVASRLQGAAPVGGVVVGELTYRITRDRIIYEELEPVTVKGKEEAIPNWRAVDARSRFGVDIEPGTATPLIGRAHELSLLSDLFERVVREQTPHLVTLSGEPGVGKSRLVREFRTRIDDIPDLLVRWRQGRCLPYGEGITFWALGEVVKSHAGILENDAADEAAAKLELAVESLGFDDRERDWIRARLAPLAGITEEAPAEREESFAAWRAFLEAIASSDPFIMVIEDLHWADPAMLAFVEHLADWSTEVPLFVVCTARPELYDRDADWGGGKRNHTAVAISPLSEQETSQLIAALLEQAVLPAETQRALLAQAGGNPLYAEEFIHMLIDRDILVRRGASWELAAGTDIPVPENVQALIAARIDTLPAERKALLQDGAVLGKVFWAGAVAEMGGRDPRRVREELHELARKELLRPARRASIEGEVEYAFQHILIRDVAYGQIPRGARVVKHRAAAAWIEGVAGERVADSAELLAYHYEQALELVRATGEDPSELEVLARRFLLMAAARASRLDAVRFKEYLTRALALTRRGDPERLEVLGSGARGWGFSGETDDALARDWLEEARLQSDELAEGEALAVLSYIAWARGDTFRQAEFLEASLSILERHPPGRELAFAYTRAAAAAGLAGRVTESLPLIERALPVVSEFGDEIGLSILTQFRGQARADFGDVEQGLADLGEGIRLALESAPAGIVVAAHINLADTVWFQDGPEEGLALYRQASEIGDRRGAVGNANWARMESMWPLFDLGRWDEILEVADGLLEVADAGMQMAILTETFRQLVLVNRGSLEAATMIENRIVPRAREIGDGQVVVPAFRLGAMVRSALGDASGALALIEEAGTLMHERPGFRGWLLDDSVRICLATGERDVLVTLLDGYTPFTNRDRSSALTAEAAKAELEGDLDNAISRYAEAAERWAAFPHVLEHGHALIGVGRCLLAIGREVEARERLREARELFVSLGGVPLVVETDDLLASATAKTS
jgi:class 3 adenylate cyclase/tetratricopeptide (TPR) repeat protein